MLLNIRTFIGATNPDGEFGIRGGHERYRRSKPKDDTSRGLRCVRCRAGMQTLQSKVRALVHEPAVFGTKSEVLGQVIVNATSIKKNCPGLITCARDKSSEVAGRFKYQRATARQNVRFESNDFVRSSDDECSGCLVHVGRNIECTTRNEVLLRVPVVPVTRIRRQSTAEMVAIAYEKTTGVCRMLIDTASARVLGEEARTLNGNLLPRLILRGG